MKKLSLIAVVIFVFSTIAISTVAQDAEESDVEGSDDHPLISRYEGSYIIGYEQFSYDSLLMPVSPFKDDKTKTIAPEGKVTRILYAGPRGRSSLEIHRNYQIALKDAGFEILYECLDDCHRLTRVFYEGEQQLDNRGDLSKHALSYDNTKDGRYLVAKLSEPEEAVFVSIYTALNTANYLRDKEKKEIKDRPITLLQIVEEKPMETGKVKVNLDAGAMAEHLDKSGSVRLYGVHFDTDKATIKPKSKTTLAEIGTLLKQHSKLRLAVVGHTDATGSFEHNMTLSQRRAKAVVEYLKAKHEIAASRLEPYGVGYLAPIATNETEEGRALNRRVELIKLY